MVYLIAGVLLGAAVAILTLPWSRRDPDDFSMAELGYAWRGPRGALLGALRTLIDVGVAKRSRRRGVVRTDEPLPSGLDPFTRAVYGRIGTFEGLGPLREQKSVRERLPAVAKAVVRAGLRVGPVRRALGSLVALAAPAVALVGLVRGVGGTGTAIAVSAVTVLVAGRLVALRGLTFRGGRTVAAAPRAESVTGGRSRRGELVNVGDGLPIRWMLAGVGEDFTSAGFAFDDVGGAFGGGFDGGGFDGGGDSSSGY